MRETVIEGQNPAADDEDRRLRPQRLREMVGQRDAIARLEIAINAARKREEPLGHMLFDGPPGLGKTTFATAIPREMGVSVRIASGSTLMAPHDLMPYLTSAERHSILFIDEIHRMSKAAEEFLYPAMEDFRIDIVLGEGVSARTISMPLQPFTLIGATTRAGVISAPLRDRFQLREHLEFYSEDDLAEIVTRNAAKLSVEITRHAANEIAQRSRGTPRVANNHLRWVRDFATSETPDGRVSREVALAALEMAKVDGRGLDEQDRKYLRTIANVFGGGPAGVDAVAHTMNLSPDTLEDDVEPFLLRIGFIVRTPRGRKMTAEAYAHLGLVVPAGAEAEGGQKKLF
ncbi:MAG: Holliday junction branch migration DNA helicase RuvB [Planctomycetia bacterium]|nr:Holliday junction branch migration DNA helicase RuvB [Planctomycetia bacterium]